MLRSLRRPLLAVALVAALAAALASCGRAAPTDVASPVRGGTLTVALPSDPSCLDPQQTGQRTASEVARQVVDSLTDQDPGSGAVVPWLAESFRGSDDAREYTFTLRPNVTFSDGTPLDSHAVRGTFDGLVARSAQGAASYLGGYTGTRVVDERTFVVTFDRPNAQFLQATSLTGLGILSPATMRAGLAERCRGALVGSGPFRVAEYRPDEGVLLRRRAGYAWESSASRHPGEALLDEVHFLFVVKPAARTAALASGQVEVAEDLQPVDQDVFVGDGFSLLTAINPGAVPPLSLNHRGVLADPRLRRALLLGVDRADLVSTMFGPRGRVATSVLSSSTPFARPRPELVRFDPAAAAALLDAAGWRVGPDGVRERDGRPLRLVWLIPAPIPPFKEHVQQQLRRLGVDVVLDAVPPAVYGQRLLAADFDLTAVDVTRADPDVLRDLFSTAGDNVWGLAPSALDRLLDRQAGEAHTARRQAAVDAAVTHLIDQAHTVPLYETALVHGVADTVQDLRVDRSVRLTLRDAWILP